MFPSCFISVYVCIKKNVWRGEQVTPTRLRQVSRQLHLATGSGPTSQAIPAYTVIIYYRSLPTPFAVENTCLLLAAIHSGVNSDFVLQPYSDRLVMTLVDECCCCSICRCRSRWRCFCNGYWYLDLKHANDNRRR